MKVNTSILVSFILLVVIASVYRIIPGRPWGFTPQIAMALFGGSIVKDKKFAFLMPLASMFLSDLLYELLYINNLTSIEGFYSGQWINYLLFAGLTAIGFFIQHNKWFQILAGSVVGVFAYFVLSNFTVWIGGGLDINNVPYPKTFNGLMYCFAAGLPFLKGMLTGTLFFSAVLFGGYYLLQKTQTSKQTAGA
ncbi:MAG TPA: hypothetical protein PKC39_04775 [Ferruginibacter sp.]|nr:hypothetical protein [Ferruginibacter sp.]HMP20254.1 hypothetical protein [Ferruginibacter sp.]